MKWHVTNATKKLKIELDERDRNMQLFGWERDPDFELAFDVMERLMGHIWRVVSLLDEADERCDGGSRWTHNENAETSWERAVLGLGRALQDLWEMTSTERIEKRWAAKMAVERFLWGKGREFEEGMDRMN